MTVLHGGLAVAGVLSVSIPIIIHLLFRQRRKPIEWAAMRFLLEAYRKARRRMRLEQWLLLLVRCVMVLLLGLGLARLLLSSVSGAGLLGSGGRIVYLLIDNGVASTVMYSDTRGEFDQEESALDRQKQAALEIIDSLSPSDRVGLITLAQPARAVISPPAVDLGAVRRMVDSIHATDAPADIETGMRLLAQSIEEIKASSFSIVTCMLSEFRRGSVDLGSPIGNPLAGQDEQSITLLASMPAQSTAPNVQIVAVDPVRYISIPNASDGSGQVRVTLRRTGDVSQSTISSLRVAAEGITTPAPITIEWEPGQTEAHTDVRIDLANVEPGTIRLSTMIDPDALASDNERFTALAVREAIRVGVVDRREVRLGGDIHRMSPGAWFRRAINPGEGSPLIAVNVDPSVIEPVTLRDLDVLVVTRPDLVTTSGWQAISTFVVDGGLLWLVPPADQDIALWADDARTELGLPWMWKREVIRPDDDVFQPRALVLEENQPIVESLDTFTPSAEQPQSQLLNMLQAELEALLRPVHVFKYLPIESGLDPDGVVLQLDLPARLSTDTGESNGDQNGDGVNPSWRALMASTVPPDATGTVVYLAAAPHLDWTTLPAQPFMVALVHETIRQGLGASKRRDSIAAGSDRPLLVPQTASALRYPTTLPSELAGTLPETIALEANGTRRQTIEPLAFRGYYPVIDAAGRVIDRIAVNVSSESTRTDTQSPADVVNWLNAATASIGDWQWIEANAPAARLLTRQNAGIDVSWYLLLALLALAILETILARIVSHATLSTSTGAVESEAASTGLESVIQRMADESKASKAARYRDVNKPRGASTS